MILSGMFGTGGGVAAGLTYTTLDSSNKDPSVTLSGGNLIASFSSSFWASVKGVASKSSGKFYYEAKVTAASVAGTRAVGVGTSAASTSGYPGQDASAWGHLSDGYKTNAGFSAYGSAWDTLNDIAMVAVDIDAGKVWFGVNGVWMASGDPAAGTNPAFSTVAGPIFPMVGGAHGNPQLTLNFGTGGFVHATPPGFTGWTV